jgi:hypothetical protein
VARILVFIDESGTPNETETMFSVAAVWCAPKTHSGSQSTLRYSVENLKVRVRELDGVFPQELKFSACSHCADDLFTLLGRISLEDFSIHSKVHPWNGPPLVFTTALANCRAESVLPITGSTTRKRTPELGNIIRARLLAESLRPICIYSEQEGLEISVILDDFVWNKALKYFGPHLEKVVANSFVDLSFSSEKSSRTPGLQIADLVAGATRRFTITARNEAAFRMIGERTLHHLGKKAATGVKPIDKQEKG